MLVEVGQRCSVRFRLRFDAAQLLKNQISHQLLAAYRKPIGFSWLRDWSPGCLVEGLSERLATRH